MADDTAGDLDPELRETIRAAMAEMGDRDLVEINVDGPQVEVVVDVYTVEDGERQKQERALYAVSLEPAVNVDSDDEIEADKRRLEWTYLGPVSE